jgi:hypothetical protein
MPIFTGHYIPVLLYGGINEEVINFSECFTGYFGSLSCGLVQ